MVACTQPLAADIGRAILERGGNAADAAVAMAAAMNVCEPTSTGIGGDVFGLYYRAKGKSVESLNSSGRSPAALTLERAARDILGCAPVAVEGVADPSVPMTHIHSITVPGAAAGWWSTHRRWGSGRFTLAELLEPAARLAERGVPVSEVTADMWARGAGLLRTANRIPDPKQGENEPVQSAGSAGWESHPQCAFLDAGGRPPSHGQVYRNPDLARSLRTLATDGLAGFYGGRIGQAVVEAVRSRGGLLEVSDLTAHEATFEPPIHVDYHGVRVFECPPNGQGLAALEALGILERVRTPSGSWPLEGDSAAAAGSAAVAAGAAGTGGCGPAERMHLEIESMRLAFADARQWVADPEQMPAPVDRLLSDEYLASRAAAIDANGAPGKRRLVDNEAGRPLDACDTVSFQVVDGEGNACSFINSNYHGFGTGIVPAGCGFTLQNRGANFNLNPAHRNCIGPAKRSYHTIIPGMAVWAESGELFANFSCMGGFMQPQGHMQLLTRLAVLGMDPQRAIDAPRFCIDGGSGDVLLEDSTPAETVARLREMGHKVRLVSSWERFVFGRAQIILRHPTTGVLWGGSDPRGGPLPRRMAEATAVAPDGGEPLRSIESGAAVGFVGVGLMGSGMAVNLAKAGFQLQLFNRTTAKAEACAKQINDDAAIAGAARVFPSAVAAAAHADAVVVMLSDGPSCDQVILGSERNPAGLLAAMRPGSLLLVCSSIPVETAELQAAVAKASGVNYIDAPVSGGERGAAAGTLAIMAGGSAEAFTAARPVLLAMGRPTLVGPPGCGMLAKLCNQCIVGSAMVAVAEAVSLARGGGADPEAMIAALAGGFADSAVLREHGSRMARADFQPGGPLKYMLKDVRAATALAAQHGLRTPASSAACAAYEEAVAAGDGELDVSAVVRRVAAGQE